MEILIQRERNTFEEYKKEWQYDLLKERELRVKQDEMMVVIKEELMNKDVELSKLIADYKLRLEEELQDKSLIMNERKLIEEKCERIESTYREKLTFLDENHKKNIQALSFNLQMAKQESEKLRTTFQEEIQQYNREFENKINNIELEYDKVVSEKETIVMVFIY
jgi:hypothetical protein